MDYVSNRISARQTSRLKELATFLAQSDLTVDQGVTDFIEVRLDGEIVACGGVDHNIIKCVAIDPEHRGGGLSLRLVSELRNIAHDQGFYELFLYTKPDNIPLFSACGFYPIVQHDNIIVLMENSPDRLKNYCKQLASQKHEGKKIGSIVMNANPFTLGHQHLVKTAAAECNWLHVFVVKEDVSFFPYAHRFELVKEGIAGIDRVTLHPGSDYIISRASFPSYFLKTKEAVENGYTALDLKLFREYIAPSLGITHRFVGTEPIDQTTCQYNKDMQYYLFEAPSPTQAITVVEYPRIESDQETISASKVRAALQQKDFNNIKQLVPPSTYTYLYERFQGRNDI